MGLDNNLVLEANLQQDLLTQVIVLVELQEEVLVDMVAKEDLDLKEDTVKEDQDLKEVIVEIVELQEEVLVDMAAKEDQDLKEDMVAQDLRVDMAVKEDLDLKEDTVEIVELQEEALEVTVLTEVLQEVQTSQK